MLERQPDSLPTNKAATTAAGTLLLMPLLAPAMQEVWPQIAPAFLTGPAFTALAAAVPAALISLGVAWFVPDRKGTAVISTGE